MFVLDVWVLICRRGRGSLCRRCWAGRWSLSVVRKIIAVSDTLCQIRALSYRPLAGCLGGLRVRALHRLVVSSLARPVLIVQPGFHIVHTTVSLLVLQWTIVRPDPSAPLSHRQCHMPLAPRSPDEVEDEEQGVPQSVQLLSEDGVPRPSEEESAWRGGQRG